MRLDSVLDGPDAKKACINAAKAGFGRRGMAIPAAI